MNLFSPNLHKFNYIHLQSKTHLIFSCNFNLSSVTMNNSPSNSRTSTSAIQSENSHLQMVPELSSDEMNRISEEAMKRYSSNSIPKRKGKGVGIVWFRNDLRVLDNEALFRAWISSEVVLPVYCVDPRIFNGTTHHFGFPKTGGENLLPASQILEEIIQCSLCMQLEGILNLFFYVLCAKFMIAFM